MNLIAGIFDFFVNPWLLFGLVLLSAPIIIHLLNRRHYEVMGWAAMDFLLQAESQNRKRIRLEDLILLFLRMLLLGLIVFAVSRPLLQGLGVAREDERILVFDDSLSMAADDGTGSAFSAARSSIVQQVEDAVGRSIPLLVWSGTSPDLDAWELAGRTEDRADGAGDGESTREIDAVRLLDTLRERRVSDLPLRLAGVLGKLHERFEARRQPEARTVVLVSDFRAADWFEEDSHSLRSDLAQTLAAMQESGVLEDIRFRFVDVGRPGRENVAITALRLSSDHPRVKVPVRLVVEVTNFGEQDRKFLTGELEVWEGLAADSYPEPPVRPRAGETLAPPAEVHQRVPLPALPTVPAGGKVTVEVELTFEKTGQYAITARLEPDQLARDDSNFTVADVREGLHVLVVDGASRPERFSRESGFLLPALAPRGSLASGILPRRFVGEIGEAELDGIDVVLILNRSEVASAERSVLEDFLRRGGGLAFFLGDQVSAERYRGLSIFPATLQGVAEGAERVHLRIGETPHPAFDVFRGLEGSSLERVRFDRFFALDPSSRRNRCGAVRRRGGHPRDCGPRERGGANRGLQPHRRSGLERLADGPELPDRAPGVGPVPGARSRDTCRAGCGRAPLLGTSCRRELHAGETRRADR